MSEATYDWPADGKAPALTQVLDRATKELREVEATLASDWQPDEGLSARTKISAVNKARALVRQAAVLLDDAALL